jgi:hypothetical protein
VSLKKLGRVAYAEGDYAVARVLFKEGLAITRELGDKLGIAYALEPFIGLAVVQDQPARALHLAGATAALREALGAPLPPDEQARVEGPLATARQALGEETAAEALAAGRAMTMEQAIAYALEEAGQV